MSEVWDDFSIDVTISGRDATCIVAGELDLASAPLLARELAPRFEGRVTIDLAGITFIDSAGLRALIAARDDLQSRDRQFVIGPRSPAAQHVFELTGLGDILGDGNPTPV